MRFSPPRLLALMLLALPSSCILSRNAANEPISQEKIRMLVPGKTTAKQVVDLFGAPNDVVQLADRSAYLYEHSKGKTAGIFLVVLTLVNSDTRQDRLWVFFDENKVLTHYGATREAARAGWSLPWSNQYEEPKAQQ